jgi:hypothetical protein
MPFLVACAGASDGARRSETEPSGSPAPAFTFEGTRWGSFHSKRFELSVGLPDGQAWRIDDHRTPWLFATHDASRSSLRVRSWAEEQLVNYQACYARAREWEPKLPDLEALRVIDDHSAKFGQGMDARVVVGIEPPSVRQEPSGKSAPASSGFVIAVGASVRKCMIVAYQTAGSMPEEIAGKLVVVTDRLVGSVKLDESFVPGREPLPARR